MANEYAIGYQLDNITDGDDIGLKATGSLAVDAQIPFNAGEWQRVFDINIEVVAALHILRHYGGDGGQIVQILTAHFNFNALALRRALLAFFNFYFNTGKAFGAFIYHADNLRGGNAR